MGMFLLRMACVEPRSKAIKTLAILLMVRPSKIVRFKNTGVWIFIRRASGIYRSAFSYVFTWQLHVDAMDLSPRMRFYFRWGQKCALFRAAPIIALEERPRGFTHRGSYNFF